jgi:UDPglucose 6-dehydrogenase
MSRVDAERIVVMGAGPVGLVTAACLADWGHEVVVADTDAERIERLEKGEVVVYEPGLPELVTAGRSRGRLRFTIDGAEAMASAEIIFLCVGTSDLSHLEKAAHTAARAASEALLVVKSTAPPGTCRRLAESLGGTLTVVSNPEFLREGSAVEDFQRPDRMIIGALRPEEALALRDGIYAPLIARGTPCLITTLEAAELVKCGSNAFLAMKVAFINELARLAGRVDADVLAVAEGMGLDPRIGPAFLRPGPGFGGSCLPKDTRMLAATARDLESPLRLVEATVASNEAHMGWIAEVLGTALGGSLAGKTLGVLGLAFKAGTDDVRDAPAHTILPPLMADGVRIRAYDPKALQSALAALPELVPCSSAEAVAQGADALLLLTEWEAFKELDLGGLRGIMRPPPQAEPPVFMDARNLLDPEAVRAAGFRYIGVGRG